MEGSKEWMTTLEFFASALFVLWLFLFSNSNVKVSQIVEKNELRFAS